MRRLHFFDRSDYGTFFDGKGRLLGHESRDVMGFLQDHPEFTGRIYFEREDFVGDVDVTEAFLGEEEAADVAVQVAA